MSVFLACDYFLASIRPLTNFILHGGMPVIITVYR